MKTLFLSECVVVVLSLLLPISSDGLQTQNTVTDKKKQVEATRTLFGVELSPGATKLLNEVETIYGSPIRERENSSLNVHVHGKSTVRIDGVPEIQINPINGKTETTIVHELMHLLGYAEGIRFPILAPVLPDTESARNFIMKAEDQVEHAYFFPKVRALGIDPTVIGKADLHTLFEQSAIGIRSGKLKEDRSDELSEANLALLYFECVAVLQDKGLAAELQKIAFFPDDEEARRLGPLAVDLTKGNFTTPEDELKIFIEVCNTLLDGKFHLSLVGFAEQQRGKIDMKYADILVQRVVSKPE
jgi:hypothetical protein